MRDVILWINRSVGHTKDDNELDSPRKCRKGEIVEKTESRLSNRRNEALHGVDKAKTSMTITKITRKHEVSPEIEEENTKHGDSDRSDVRTAARKLHF